MDPRVPIKPPRKPLRGYLIIFGSNEAVEQPALALNEVAKYVALKFLQKALKQGRIKKANIGRE